MHFQRSSCSSSSADADGAVPLTYFLLRDALATCDQIHYTKVIEYIQNVPLTEVWIEPETSCIKLQCNTAYTTGLWLQWVGIGYDYTTSRRVAEKKNESCGFSRRTFGSSQTSTNGKSSEHKNQRVWFNVKSNNKISYFCNSISYGIP